VLADIAEEIEEARPGPVHSRCREPRGFCFESKSDESGQLLLMHSTLCASFLGASRLRSVDRPPGSPIMPVAPAGKRDRVVTGELETGANMSWPHEVPDMEGCRRWGRNHSKSVIGPVCEPLAEAGDVGAVRGQSAPR